MKNLRRLACKFDLDQSERKSSQVNASARKSWPNGVASRGKFSTCGYLRLRLARALHCARAPSLFVAVSKAKMSRQTTLGRIAHRNSVIEMKREKDN